MAEIKKSLGIYDKAEADLMQKERTALLSLLNQLNNNSIECAFDIEFMGASKRNLFAIVRWDAKTNRESLQLERRIENILSQVGKK